MKDFTIFLDEMANTTLSDSNEILIGFFLNNNRWFSTEAKEQFRKREEEIPKSIIKVEKEKAKAMADAFIAWAKENGYSGIVKKVWWTARPRNHCCYCKETS